MSEQNKDFNSVQNLSNIGTSLSDFEEISSETKNYTILGIDQFGFCEKMKSKKNNMYYMIKKIPKDTRFNIKNFKRENKIQSQLNNENIIKLYGYFEDIEKASKINEIYKKREKILEDAKVYCLVLEFAKNGSLREYLSKHKEKYKEDNYIPIEQDFIFKILTQALSALNYMQSQSVLHRNLILNNILLDENNNIKIADFEWSALMKDNNPINKDKDPDLFCNEKAGRMDIVCPEILNDKEYDYKADIFSLGISMLCLMRKNKNKTITFIEKDGKRERSINIENMDESYCEELKKLVKEMIKENPEKRINCQKAYYKILQINNSEIIHSPNFNPIKYLYNIGIQLSDFEEIKKNRKIILF